MSAMLSSLKKPRHFFFNLHCAFKWVKEHVRCCTLCMCTLSAVVVLINPDGLILISKSVEVLYSGKCIWFWAWEWDDSDTDSSFLNIFLFIFNLFSF